MFNNDSINLEALRKKAFNGRWATCPPNVIPLTAADPDFPIALEIVEGIYDYIKDGYLSYGPFSGLDEFKTAVANHYNLRKGCSYQPQHVLAVNSAAQGMYLIAKYLLQPGDEAIIFDPVDFLFKKTVEACGGKVTLCAVDTDTGSINLAQLESLISPATKLISICNPHNPVGKVYGRKVLKQIADIAMAHNIWVMSDEIWSDIVYDEQQYVSYAAISEQVALKCFTVYGFSKTFGLAGLRIGAVLCKDEAVMNDFIEKSNFNSTIEGVSTLSQIAATVALNKAWHWATNFIGYLKHNRDLAFDMLNSSSILEATKPEATYVIFPKIKNGLSSEAFVQKALEKSKVAIVPGSARWFGPGAEGHVRICFATSKEILEEGLHRLIKNL